MYNNLVHLYKCLQIPQFKNLIGVTKNNETVGNDRNPIFQIFGFFDAPIRTGLFFLESLRRLYLAILSSLAAWAAIQVPENRTDKKSGLQDIPGPLSLPIFGALWLYSCFGPYTR